VTWLKKLRSLCSIYFCGARNWEYPRC